jgi:Transmembrane secretion effector
MTTLYVSAQDALPNWVRARGLSIFLTVIFGSMTVGSAVWGEIADTMDLPSALFLAAAGALLAIPLTWRWTIQGGAKEDLSPSTIGQSPMPAQTVENNRGPAMVTVEYRVSSKNRSEFLDALDELRHERRRDGAFAWGVYEDSIDSERYLETFLIESWLELLHLRERVTNSDRVFEENLQSLLTDPPQVTYSIAPERAHRFQKWRARREEK